MTPRAVSLLLVSALLVLSTGAYVAHSVRDARLRSTGAYAVAMKRVSLDAAVGAALGRPITRGLWIEAERSTLLTLRIPLQGTIADGTITLVSSIDGAQVESMLLEANGQRTDLLAIDAQQLLSNASREAWTEGSGRVDRGEYAAAVESLDEALERDETIANAWYLRGQAKLELGALEGAERDLIEAARLDPDDPAPPALLGRLYTMSRRYEDCVEAYTTVLSLDSESSPIWHLRAICYEGMRDHRRALAGAREACTGGLKDACRMQDRLKRDRYEMTALQ